MKQSRGEVVFGYFNIGIMLFVVAATLLPFVTVVARSLSSETAVISGSVNLWPVDANLRAYERAIAQPQFWTGYRNTVIYVVVTVIVHVLLTAICAYPLSKKHLYGRKLITGFIVFTMFFSGGLIPRYLLVRSLGMINTIWAIVLPTAIQVWHMIIMRTFFQGIPESIEEQARIDGLSPIGVLVRIVAPLSAPIIATISLFVAVFQWNNWFQPMIYFTENSRFPVTLYLRNIVIGAQMAVRQGQRVTEAEAIAPVETLKASTVMLVTVPILAVYPFLQKYFVKGVMIGSLKG
jgi:putative aldouronate transport system permease protein